MFPNTYFAPRYFAPVYFPPVSAVRDEDPHTYDGFSDVQTALVLKREDEEMLALIAAFMEIV